MKLLIISNNPTRASFRQRIGIYIDLLESNGIKCEVRKIPAWSLQRIQLFKKARGYGMVFLHKKGLNPLDAFFVKRYSRKIIYDFDDAIMYKPSDPERESKLHLNKFRRSVESAEVVIAGNSYLAEQARQFNTNVKIIPTGLDTQAYKGETRKQNTGKLRLVWIGSKSTLAYLAEIKPALEQIGSKFDNVVLKIICDRFFDLDNMEVEKQPWSLETYRVHLVNSNIGLSPLPDNRFTRGKCGFKILQYAAAGLPVVASPVGVNAELVREGTGLIANTTEKWVDNVSQLIQNEDLRKQMGEEGRKFVEKYEAGIIGGKLLKAIETCQQD